MALSDNLVASYELDESSGNALDSVGGLTLTETSGTIDAAVGPGGVGGSRDFELADTEYFVRPSAPALVMGDIDFTIECWLWLESKPAAIMCPWMKFDHPLNKREYVLQWINTTDRFTFTVSSNGASGGNAAVTANTFGAPSIGQWYQVICWHDSVANQIGICVNAGTPNTTAHSAGVFASNSDFAVGAYVVTGGPSTWWDGLIAKMRVWKRLLTSTERTQLYNGGTGLAYSALGGSVPVTLITSWW